MPVLREWERQGTGKSGERCRVGKADRCPGSVPSECSQFHGDGAMVARRALAYPAAALVLATPRCGRGRWPAGVDTPQGGG